MPKQATPVAVAADFSGILTNVDPRDIPAGAAEEQTNICSIVTGELRVRLGIIEVVFEAES